GSRPDRRPGARSAAVPGALGAVGPGGCAGGPTRAGDGVRDDGLRRVAPLRRRRHVQPLHLFPILMRALAAIRVGLFVIALVLPLLGTYPADGPVPNEQRSRAPLPALLVERSRYPELFDAFFRDNFGGRDRLIRWHNLLKFRVFRESPVRKVIVGRKDWLFLSTPEDGFDIRNFSGHWPHQSTDVDSWLVQLDARERDYARAGARYLIAIAPDKQSMYPELVPARYGPPAPGVLSELLERLPAHPRLDVLDLYPALRPHPDIQLYLRGDPHWNATAGFSAARAIPDSLRASLPAVGAIREADYVVTTKPVVGGDLVKMLALGIDL